MQRRRIAKVGESHPETGLPASSANQRMSMLARAHRFIVGKNALQRAAGIAQKSRTVHAVTRSRK